MGKTQREIPPVPEDVIDRLAAATKQRYDMIAEGADVDANKIGEDIFYPMLENLTIIYVMGKNADKSTRNLTYHLADSKGMELESTYMVEDTLRYLVNDNHKKVPFVMMDIDLLPEKDAIFDAVRSKYPTMPIIAVTGQHNGNVPSENYGRKYDRFMLVGSSQRTFKEQFDAIASQYLNVQDPK